MSLGGTRHSNCRFSDVTIIRKGEALVQATGSSPDVCGPLCVGSRQPQVMKVRGTVLPACFLPEALQAPGPEEVVFTKPEHTWSRGEVVEMQITWPCL